MTLDFMDDDCDIEGFPKHKNLTLSATRQILASP
jgi:hypothetical protein